MTDVSTSVTSVPVVPRRKRGWRYVLNLLVATLVTVVVTIVLFGAFQGAVGAEAYFRPGRASLCCTPADVGLAYENVTFITRDDLTLHGWYLPTQNGRAVLIAHGLHQTRENTFNIARILQAHGYGVLAFDLRGHGESDGELLTDVYRDGLAAVDYLESREEIMQIGAFGFSLGGVVVLHTAALDERVEAIVTDGAGFTEYEDMPAPTTPVEWLYVGYDFAFFRIGKPRFGSFGPSSTLAAAAKIGDRPQLYIASDTEWRMVKSFADAAGNAAEYWYIQGVNHGEGSHLHRDEYEQRLIGFYDAAFAGS